MISGEVGFALGFGSLLLLVCLGFAAAKETIIFIIIINVIFLLLDSSLFSSAWVLLQQRKLLLKQICDVGYLVSHLFLDNMNGGVISFALPA